jgi:hypothetical protein
VIKAMDYAVQGMRQATNQANDAAGRIIRGTSNSLNVPEQATAPETITSNNTGPVRTATRDLVAPNSDTLIFDIVDLKVAELNFKANAAVYKRMADMTDEFINNFARKT